jgi:hypothetical protein
MRLHVLVHEKVESHKKQPKRKSNNQKPETKVLKTTGSVLDQQNTKHKNTNPFSRKHKTQNVGKTTNKFPSAQK